MMYVCAFVVCSVCVLCVVCFAYLCAAGKGSGEGLAVCKKNKNPTLRMWGHICIYMHIDILKMGFPQQQLNLLQFREGKKGTKPAGLTPPSRTMAHVLRISIAGQKCSYDL